VNRFEQMVADRAGGGYAVATANGTAALHVALLLAGVEAGSEVLVPALTFIAPANAVRYVGAHPVFFDAEPEYAQIDPAKLADFLDTACAWRDGRLYNRSTGRRVAAVLPVHLLGHPADMDPILAAAGKYDLPVIEDATESLGASYKGRPVGSLGAAACFSFNGNKLVTTGGGGMLVTGDPERARRAKYLTTQAKDDEIEYVHGEVGFNYRLTNVQAAIGCAQVELLDEYIAAKRRIAARYAEALADVPGITPMRQAPWADSVFWMYTVRVDAVRYGCDSRALLARLAAANIQSRPLWQPMHRSPAHRGSQPWRCEVADALYRDCLSLPCSVGLTNEQQRRVIQVVCEAARSH
jgi:perosamine synthetase